MPLNTIEVDDIDWLKEVAYPRGVRFREIIITGPPGSGKSTLVQKLGGWPEEGYLDLAKEHWWRSRLLTFRPREVHFGIPFRGFRQSVSVIDTAWLESQAKIDFRRIQLPHSRSLLLRIDWRTHYIFDFQLPPLDQLYQMRVNRASRENHPVDKQLSMDIVQRQLEAYEQIAMHFHRSGMRVIVRTEYGGKPEVIRLPESD